MRVLLVDGHADTTAVLQLLFQSHGHAAVATATVEEALAACAGAPFDLMIAELRLPGAGDGFDLIRAVRARFGLRGIALTGSVYPWDIARARQAGFELHLAKPTGVEFLILAAEAVDQGTPTVLSAA